MILHVAKYSNCFFACECFQSPEFLVFLDCMWQLLQQFPAAFEFTETYLTTLWDSAHISVFETFLFDCERDRTIAASVSI